MQEYYKRQLLIVLMCLTLLMPLFFVERTSATASGTFLYVSALLGYAGVTLLLWMYIIGTRSVTGFLFHDQAGVMKIHQWIGKYGVLFIFLHPLFVVLSYGESIMYIVVPHIGTAFENHITLGRIALYILLVIWLSSAILRSKIAYRPWKYLHYLAYITVPFALLHVPDVGTSYLTAVAARVYLYGAALVLISITLVRLRSWLNLDTYRYTIASQQQLNSTTQLLRLTPEAEYIVPRPGQYVYLRLGLLSESHPFSVVRTDAATHELTLAYRTRGRFTRFLQEWQAGSRVFVSRPYGTFTREIDEDTRPTVFVAGGIGVTPFVERIMERDTASETWLFYSNPTPELATFMKTLRKSLPAQRLVALYRDATGDVYGESRRIDADMFRDYLGEPTAYRYFICGSSSMVLSTRRSLQTLGVPPDAVHIEEFSF